MNRRIGLILAVALFVGAANAAIFKNLAYQGEIYTKAYYLNNAFDLGTNYYSWGDDELRKAQTRFTFGTSFDILEDVHGKMTFVYGANSWNANQTGIWGQPAMGDVNDLLDSVEIAEANFTIDNLFMFDSVKIGKQYYGQQGDLVVYFGPRESDDLWHDSIDAIVANYTSNLFDIEHKGHFMYGKAWEFGFNSAWFPPLGVGDYDISIWGWDHTAFISDAFNFGLRIYNGRTGKNDNGFGGIGIDNDTNLWVVSAKANGNVGSFDYYFELLKNFGQGETVEGYQTTSFTGFGLMAKAAYNAEIEGFGGFKPRAMFFYGSGDNQGQDLPYGYSQNKNLVVINSGFQPGEIFGKAAWLPFGNADFFWSDGAAWSNNSWYTRSPFQYSLANLQVWNLGLEVMPTFAEKWQFGLDYFRFFLNSIASEDGGNKHIGSEIDLVAQYNHSDNITLKFIAARFWAGSYLKSEWSPTSPVTKLATELIVKFGSND